MEVEVNLAKKYLPVKSQSPKDNAVVDFSFKFVDGILKIDGFCVDVVGDVFLKKRRKIRFQLEQQEPHTLTDQRLA